MPQLLATVHADGTERAVLRGVPMIPPARDGSLRPQLEECAMDRIFGAPRRVRNPRIIPVAQRSRIMERDGFRCRRCGIGPRDERLVIDHVVPVAMGGRSDDENLQTLCEPCNQGKADRPPHPHDLEGLG